MHSIPHQISQHKLQDSIYEIDGVYFPIDSSWSKISISISGGADSALLSYLLCKTIKEQNLKIDIHIISNVRMWKTRPWQRFNSIDVFNWLSNNFPSLRFIRHEHFIPPEIEYGRIGPLIEDSFGQMKSGDQISTRSYAEYICYTNNINAWFAGITKNPPEDFSSDGMNDRNVDELEDLNSVIIDHQGICMCHPFKYKTKDWILKHYVENNILDLFHLTRSCEGEFDLIDYRNYKQGQIVPTCEKCFWCRERNWALSKICTK